MLCLKSIVRLTDVEHDRELHLDMTVLTPTSEDYMLSIRNQYIPFKYFLNKIPPTKNLRNLIFMPPQTLQIIMSAIESDCHTKHQYRGLERIHYSLSAILLAEEDEHSLNIIRSILSGNEATASIELLKVTVFLLSNKHLYPKSKHLICDELLRWFQMGDNYLFLKSILSYKMPTIEALAEDLFASAINDGDRRIVRLFLDCGMSSNAVVDDRTETRKCSALQLATAIGNYEIVKLLLKFRADANFSGSGLMSRNGLNTPLGIAARSFNVPIVHLLIANGASIFKGDNGSGATPLHHAAVNEHTDIATVLLEMGADVNAHAELSETPLEIAIRSNRHAMVDLLLKRGAWVNGPSEPFYRTPLQLAAMLNNIDLVKILLQMGAHANSPAPKCKNCSGDNTHCADVHEVGTALQGAAENGSLQVCQMFFDFGADINAAPSICTVGKRKKGTTGLCAAIRSGNCVLVDVLLTCGADVNDERGSHTALEAAFTSNQPAMLQLILSARPRLDKALVFAVKIRNTDLILQSLEVGADINAMQTDSVANCRDSMQTVDNPIKWYPLSMAVAIGDKDLVDLLLRQGAWPNPAPGSGIVIPLVEAAYKYHHDFTMIDMLLAVGADPNIQECNWRRAETFGSISSRALPVSLNALQIASRKGDLDLVRHFLESGADINWSAAENQGRTALQAAIESGNSELIQFLIDEGADVNSPAAKYYGVTALVAAVRKGNKGCTIKLLAEGAHVDNVELAVGTSSPLVEAAMKGDDEIVKLLLDHGAQIDRKSREWQLAALQGAALYGHWETVKLLLDRGADANGLAGKAQGLTALQAAAIGGYLHIADMLVKYGADVNAARSENNGKSALELAAQGGRIDMLKFLLNHGADTTSNFGLARIKEAIRLASIGGHHAAAKFLKYYQFA